MLPFRRRQNLHTVALSNLIPLTQMQRASEQAPFLGAFSDVVFFLSERAARDASQEELKIIPPFAASLPKHLDGRWTNRPGQI